MILTIGMLFPWEPPLDDKLKYNEWITTICSSLRLLWNLDNDIQIISSPSLECNDSHEGKESSKWRGGGGMENCTHKEASLSNPYTDKVKEAEVEGKKWPTGGLIWRGSKGHNSQSMI